MQNHHVFLSFATHLIIVINTRIYLVRMVADELLDRLDGNGGCVLRGVAVDPGADTRKGL